MYIHKLCTQKVCIQKVLHILCTKIVIQKMCNRFAVDDAAAVGVVQRPEDLGDEMEGLPPVQGGAALAHILL